MKDKFDLGFVGDVEHINTTLIEQLLENNYIPVIAPIGRDHEGTSFNINADYAAAAIAGELKAAKLIYLTDIDGVFANIADKSSLISVMTGQEARALITNEKISDGMIPKVECCLTALDFGVKFVHIINGQFEHSILVELLTDQGIGTMVVR